MSRFYFFLVISDFTKVGWVFLAILIFTVNSFSGKAQNEKYLFTNIDSDDGLPDNGVNIIFRDSKGFMWFGTADGLCRFDGSDFKVFRSNPSDSNSISTKFIEFIFEDPEGKIWTGQYVAPCIYDPKTESFKDVPLPYSGRDRLPSDYIRQVFMDQSGLVWFVYNEHGIFIYNPKDESVERIHHMPGDSTSISANAGINATEDVDGHFWIVSNKGIIEKLDRNTMEVTYRTRFKADTNMYYRIETFGNNKFWIYGINGATDLVLFDRKKESFSYFNNKEGEIQLNSHTISDVEKDQKGNIWIATGHGGIDLLNLQDQTIQYIKHNELNDKSICNDQITTLYRDNNNTIWLGSYKHGISYYNENMYVAELYRHNPNDETSLSYNDIDNFVEDENGNLWIGTNGGGLIYFNRKKNTFKNYKHDPDDPHSLSSNVIIGMCYDSKNRLWLGTYFGGLNYFDGKKFHHFKHDTDDPSGITDNRIWDIVEDENGNLWLATFLGGVNVFDPKQQKVIQLYGRTLGEKILSNDMITCIIKDSQHNMWIGTPDGLNKLNPKTGQVAVYDQEYMSESQAVNSNMIWDVFEDSRGWIWAGTDNGLNLLDQKKGIFKPIMEKNGLPHNTIMTIEEDDFGNLWVATLNGVANLIIHEDSFQIDSSLVIHTYTDKDGLQGDEYNAMASFKTSKGEILFGGSKGFNLIRPDTTSKKKIESNIVITDLQIFNKSVAIGQQFDNRTILEQSVSYSNKITLTHEQNVFTLVFADLNFVTPNEQEYKYKLEGFNNHWLYTDAQNRKATYTNLNPGTYTFKVTSSHNSGVINDNIASIIIEILPPWWKTWWFRIAAFVFLIGTIIGIYIYRVKSLQQQKIYLEEQVKHRTYEIARKNSMLHNQALELQETNTLLEERQQHIEEQSEELKSQKEELEQANLHLNELNTTKDKFFSIISHDLKNPFNMVLGFGEMLFKNFHKLTEDKKLKYAEAIYTSSRNIYNLLENLLQWSRAQTNKIEIYPTTLNLKDLIDDNVNLLKQMLEKKSIDVNYKTTKNLAIYADQNIINAVIRNLLTNAIKFSNHNDEIAIEYAQKNGQVEVAIQDNGVGMNDRVVKNLFRVDSNTTHTGTDGETGTGLGLILCKEYVEKSGGNIWVESEPGKGSSFYFTVPVAK